MRNFIIYPTLVHLYHSDKRLKKYRGNTLRLFLSRSKIRYFQNYSQLVQNLKKLKTGGQYLHDIFSTVCLNNANEPALDR